MSNNEEQNIVSELSAQFDAQLADIEARPSGQLPKMNCVLKVTNAFLERSQASGRKQMTVTTTILESNAGEEFVGKEYKKHWGLETAENWAWLKRDCKSLELEEPTTAAKLLTIANAMIGICFSAQLVPNSDEAFPPNCYINKGARRRDYEGAGSVKAGSSNL